MNTQREAFEEQFMCNFKPDERLIALDNALIKYHKDTPESMDSKTAMPIYKAFTSWVKDNGYTQEEISNAKRKYNPPIAKG